MRMPERPSWFCGWGPIPNCHHGRILPRLLLGKRQLLACRWCENRNTCSAGQSALCVSGLHKFLNLGPVTLNQQFILKEIRVHTQILNSGFFFKILFIYSRETQRGRDRQREKQALWGEPHAGLQPRTLGSHLEQKADAQASPWLRILTLVLINMQKFKIT